MKVAMIGLGVMGGAIAARLARQGHTVYGYNRTRAKAEALAAQNEGIHVAGTAGEAVAQAEIVLSMVAEDKALSSVAHGPSGILENLRPDQVWSDSSTVSPSLSKELVEDARKRGAHRLESPVSGSVSAVEAGTLSMYVAGDRAAFERAKPVLADLAQSIEHVGEPGQALALKLATNLNIALQMIGFGEGLLLAERAGIERGRAMTWMLQSVIASPMLKYRVPLIENPPEVPWFTPYMMLKDVRLALAQADKSDLPMPLTSLCADILRYAIHQGRAGQELAAVVDALEDLAAQTHT